jgi:hypothetical protein
MKEAVNTSETSVNFYQSKWRNIPEGSDLHTRRREYLRSQVNNSIEQIRYSEADSRSVRQ